MILSPLQYCDFIYIYIMNHNTRQSVIKLKWINVTFLDCPASFEYLSVQTIYYLMSTLSPRMILEVHWPSLPLSQGQAIWLGFCLWNTTSRDFFFFFFKVSNVRKQVPCGVSSLFGGEVAGVPVFWSSTSTVERKSPGCVAAAKLFNVARDLYSREWKGENSVSLRKKQGLLKYHRLDPNPVLPLTGCSFE